MKKLIKELILSIHTTLIIACSIFTAVNIDVSNPWLRFARYLFILTAIGKSYSLVHKPSDKYNMLPGSRFLILMVGTIAIIFASCKLFTSLWSLHLLFFNLVIAIGGYLSYLWIIKGNEE